MSAYWFVLRSGGWHFGERLSMHDPLYLRATTACLSAIVVMQIANVFLCRSDRQSLFTRGIFSNKIILAVHRSTGVVCHTTAVARRATMVQCRSSLVNRPLSSVARCTAPVYR